MCSQQSHHEIRFHLKEWKESIHGPSSSDCNEGHLTFVGEQCRYGRFGCISFFNCASFWLHHRTVDSRASRRGKSDLNDETIFLENFLQDDASDGTFDILVDDRISFRCTIDLLDNTLESKPDSDHSRGDSSMIGHRIVRQHAVDLYECIVLQFCGNRRYEAIFNG